MNDWYLLGILLCLALAALFAALNPLRKYKLLTSIVALIALVLLMFAYAVWGDYFGFQAHQLKQKKQQEVAMILQSPKRTDTLIQTMISRLDKTPKSTEGWYLVGKLYLSQKKYQEAQDAFAQAYALNPQHIQSGLYYAQCLWELNHQQFNEKSRQILQHVLTLDENQADALAMLATDAYSMHHYDQAIAYWERLLVLVPEGSNEAKAIRRAIVRAGKKLSGPNVDDSSNAP